MPEMGPISVGQVHWHWAKSPQCLRQLRSMDCVSFEESKCRAVMDQLDSSRCVEILQSLSSLELNSRPARFKDI